METRGKIILVLSILIMGFVISYSILREKTDLTEMEKLSLARCLTEKEIYLYGTINCPNCEVQKGKFGEAVEEIVYINCFIEEEKCDKYTGKKIYPFWGINETMLPGPIPLEKLKEITEC